MSHPYKSSPQKTTHHVVDVGVFFGPIGGRSLILVAIYHFFGVPPQGNRHWFMNVELTLEFLGLFSKFHAGDGFENVP